jgi:uncharacterized protein YebE (UPF0316 family)
MNNYTVKLYDSEGKEVETFVTKPKTKKERQRFFKDLVSNKDIASSKRFIALQLIYLVMVTFVLDALDRITINTEVTISILASGVAILLGTTIEKINQYRNIDSVHRKYDNKIEIKDDDNPTIIN